jgi:hypothetical protein
LKAKTITTLIREFCSENSYDESVEELLDFYWVHARKTLVSKKYPIVFMVGLGEFTINRKKLAQKIAKLHEYIDVLNTKDYKGFARYNAAVERLQVYKELHTKACDNVIKRNSFKQNLNAEQNQNNLEE